MNEINGELLLLLNNTHRIKELGITKYGDLLRLQQNVEKLRVGN